MLATGSSVSSLTGLSEEELDRLKYPLIIGSGATRKSSRCSLPSHKVFARFMAGPAIATGIKLANPAFEPIHLHGDGDCLASAATTSSTSAART